ncbi:MAG: hypothetical protein ACSHX7_09000 [Luteolibacter sp.]
MPKNNPGTPKELSTAFERGEIDRTEFQTLMAIHARELIAEIEEDHQNPFAAWIESRLAKSAIRKLLKGNTHSQIREVLVALSETPDFPLANYLWNASHPDIPLHCFFRINKEPAFSILSIKSTGDTTQVQIEIHKKRNRQTITFTRSATWQLVATK